MLPQSGNVEKKGNPLPVKNLIQAQRHANFSLNNKQAHTRSQWKTVTVTKPESSS